MKSLQSIIREKPLVVGSAGFQSATPSAMDMAIVDSVFSKLRVLFPVGAPRLEDEPMHKAEWLKTLAVQGIRSREQVQLGINRARREQGDRRIEAAPLHQGPGGAEPDRGHLRRQFIGLEQHRQGGLVLCQLDLGHEGAVHITQVPQFFL